MIDLTKIIEQQIAQTNPEYQRGLKIIDGLSEDMALGRRERTYAINDTIEASDRKHVDNCQKCKIKKTLDPACPSAKRRIDMAAELKF